MLQTKSLEKSASLVALHHTQTHTSNVPCVKFATEAQCVYVHAVPHARVSPALAFPSERMFVYLLKLLICGCEVTLHLVKCVFFPFSVLQIQCLTGFAKFRFRAFFCYCPLVTQEIFSQSRLLYNGIIKIRL